MSTQHEGLRAERIRRLDQFTTRNVPKNWYYGLGKRVRMRRIRNMCSKV